MVVVGVIIYFIVCVVASSVRSRISGIWLLILSDIFRT